MVFQIARLGTLLTLCLLLPVSHLQAADPVFERVSISSEGIEANNRSSSSSISADGRFVAFDSYANNLVQNDSNQNYDIFVHDRLTKQTTRVSVNTSGSQGNENSVNPRISSTGRFVAFSSLATNLVQDDTNGTHDVFVHDRQTGETTRVSIGSSGNQANDSSGSKSISGDGRFVAFTSIATNLVQNDSNGASDVFVHDRLTKQTTRVSVNTSGSQGNENSLNPRISSTGRFVAFSSLATNLVEDDTNGKSDVFVHDRQTGETTRVSISSSGDQGSDYSGSPSISGDGRYVVFDSEATNLVTDDTNGLTDIFIHDLETGITERVSVNDKGEQGEGPHGSYNPYVSEDGRYVAFSSSIANLVENNNGGHVYIKDRETGTVTQVSFTSGDLAGISSDGSYLLIEAGGIFVWGPSFLSPFLPPEPTQQQFVPAIPKLLLLTKPAQP